jgi:CubicO group peptidase (beta-lactamase class C family)
MKRVIAALLVLALAVACKGGARRTADAGALPAPEAPADLGGRVDAFVRGFGATWGEAHAAHGLVAVAKGGEIVFSHAYGMSAGLDTRFAIGSVTKTLTAALFMRLVDEKKMTLDDRAKRWLPELAMPDAERLTLRQLATHTSGLASYTDDADLMHDRTAARTHEEVLARVRAKALLFAPGARFAYSNSNYYLLGLALERAAGEPYEAALGRRLLAPAGMTRTTLTGPREDEADGRTIDADERLVPIAPPHPGLTFAASGLRSTARDLLRFDRALASGLLSDGARLEMETPHKGAYGCGWECWRDAGVEVTSHEGAVDGFSAFFARAADAKVAVVVLLATDAFAGDRLTAATIGEPILAMALRDRAVPPPLETPPVPLDPARARAVAGPWTLDHVEPAKEPEPIRARDVPAPPRLAMTYDGARLMMSPDGEPEVRLFAAEDGSLFPKQLGVRVTSGEDGGLVLDRYGRKMVYRR